MLNFELSAVNGCYGFGERTKHLNKLGDSAEYLTVDVVAVFRHTYARDDYDPTYVAIPLAILKSGERFLGLFFDNPGRAVMDAGKSRPGEFWYQSLGGNTDLYLLAGPTLAEVVRRYTALTGGRRCRRCGRWAITSAAGAIATRRNCGNWPRNSPPPTCRSAHCGTTSTIWTASGCSPGTAPNSPIPPP